LTAQTEGRGDGKIHRSLLNAGHGVQVQTRGEAGHENATGTETGRARKENGGTMRKTTTQSASEELSVSRSMTLKKGRLESLPMVALPESTRHSQPRAVKILLNGLERLKQGVKYL